MPGPRRRCPLAFTFRLVLGDPSPGNVPLRQGRDRTQARASSRRTARSSSPTTRRRRSRWSWSTATPTPDVRGRRFWRQVDGPTKVPQGAPQGRRRQDAPARSSPPKNARSQRVAQAARAQASAKAATALYPRSPAGVARKGALVGIAPVANTCLWGAKKNTGWNRRPRSKGAAPAWVGAAWEVGGLVAVCDQPRDPGPVAADPVLVRRRHRPCHPARSSD